MTLSICLATWNSMKFIRECLESIFSQTVFLDPDFEIKIAVNLVDNGSEDGTVEFIKNNYPQIHILKNMNNVGFCKSYNQAIKMHQTDWVLIMNVDTILASDFLAVILKTAERISDKIKAGSFGPKILKAETIFEDSLPKIIKTNKIDSCGLMVKKSRLVKNIGEGEIDNSQYDNVQDFFGFSGACLLFRREALEDIKIGAEYFDEDFFAYQDDFDLAWRLRLFGWQNIFVPGAKVYHFRASRINTLKPWQFLQIVRARRAKSLLINYHSYKNHFWVLVKNELMANFWRHFPFIFWLELKKFIFILFFEQKTLASLKFFFKLLPKMLFKRKIIMARRKAAVEEINKFFV